MGNMHLVTGFAGREHVTAADHGSFYAALFGSGTYVLDKGKKFELTKISDNLIRVLDGDLLMQGRHCRIEDDAYVELAVENGTQGYLRRDLVVCRYTKDADSGVEGCELVVLRGDPVGAEPADPAYVTGDIIKDGALQNDVPLYRLNLNGLEITSVDSLLPATIPVMPEKIEGVAASVAQIEAMLANPTGAQFQAGSYTGTGTNITMSLTFNFVPKFVFIHAVTTSDSSVMTNGGGMYEFAIDSLTTAYRNGGYTYRYGNMSKDYRARFEGTTLYWACAQSGATDGGMCANYKYNGAYFWYAIG